MREEILKILTECKAEIINNMQSEGVTVTGRTAGSLAVEDRGDHLLLLQKPEPKGAPIETTQFGRPAGKVPTGFRQIIKQWIVDKKIPTQPIPYIRTPSDRWQPMYTPEERGLAAAAGAIAHKIATKGTERFSNPNTNIYTEPIDKAIDKISNFLLTEITTNIRK